MLQTPFELTGEVTSVEDGNAFLQSLASKTDVRLRRIGYGIMGDPLYTATVGTGRARVAVVASVHGSEPAGREAAYAFLRDMAYAATPIASDLADQYAWTFLPTANPNGIRHNHRWTSYDGGGDINRDYAAQQLDESQAIASWLTTTQPALVLDLHEHIDASIISQIATGKQTHSGIHSDIRALSVQLHEVIASRVQAEGYTWELYPDSTASGTARNEIGRLYKATCVLSETNRAEPLPLRVEVTNTALEASADYWMAHSQEFENARITAGGPPIDTVTSGLHYTDGTPAEVHGARLYYSDGTPVATGISS